MANLRRVSRVIEILTAAGVDPDRSYFDMTHDVLFIPWREQTGVVAEQLEAAGCHWSSDGESWASF